MIGRDTEDFATSASRKTVKVIFPFIINAVLSGSVQALAAVNLSVSDFWLICSSSSDDDSWQLSSGFFGQLSVSE